MKKISPVFKKNESDTEQIKRELKLLVRKSIFKNNAGSAAGRVMLEKKSGGYIYLYDSFVQDRECKAIINGIEKRLRDFEISGKIIKLSTFTNPKILIEDEVRHGAKTVVMVGNDETFVRILSRAANLPVIFGFIPVGQRKNHFADVLGIPLNEKACEIIAARKIEKLDYATINEKQFFICYLFIPRARLKIECDGSFIVNLTQEKFEVAVANLLPPPFESDKFVLHPQDGKMEVYLRPEGGGLFSKLVNGKKRQQMSRFLFKRALLKMDKSTLVIADGKETKENSILIEVNKEKLLMIVGKNRRF